MIPLLTITLIVLSLLLFSAIVFFYRYYPAQTMPPGKPVEIKTPDEMRYRNDCLHPCIRYIPEGFAGCRWWMVQSPYYGGDSTLENPLLYCSDDEIFPVNWGFTSVVQETPETGFNSDPVIFHEGGKLWVFWREKDTPLCRVLNVVSATVGVFTFDGKTFSIPKVFLTNHDPEADTELCPILIKTADKYCFYASHYQFKPFRKGLGIAIWEGSSLEKPDFKYRETRKIKNIYTCDKYKQLKIGKQLIFIPKPLKHDIWHFDLFEYSNKLYMISVAEWGDNIILSVSDDFKNFRTNQKPLVNSHYSRQKYFYKPTVYVLGGKLHLFYTAKDESDHNRNIMFHTEINFQKIQN